MEDNRLKEQIAAFSNDKELRACFTNYYEIDIRGHQKKRHDLQHDYYLNKENFSDMFCSMPATIMIRKEVYDEIGGLHEYFDRLFAEDRYWIYLIIERYTALLLKTPLYGYRANPISLTNEIDNARKLTIVELVNELIRQRKVRGSDWLSEGAFDKAMDFEQSLMKNKRWLSEQYRIFAATQIDLLKLHQAKKLLLTAYRLNPFNFSILRTLFYLLRRPCHSVRLNF